MRAHTVVARLLVGCALLSLSACDQSGKGGANARPSGTPMGKPSGLEVVRSSSPKMSEAEFFKALDKELDRAFAEMDKTSYRSKMHLAIDLGTKMQPRDILAATTKSMGANDVAVLSLFARNPDVRTRVGKHVKDRADGASKALEEKHGDLPVVVRKDCVDAAARRLALKEVADGKRQAGPGDKVAAPLVNAVIQECHKAAEATPELTCLIEATDQKALEACP